MTPYTSAEIKTLLALLNVECAEGRATVRSVARARGVAISTAHAHLKALRLGGFVTWDDGRSGTLRAAVTPVEWSPVSEREVAA